MKLNIICAAALAVAFASCQESLEDRCEREAREYTAKKCPAPVGENTVIDSVAFNRGTHTVSYYYTLSGPADNKEAVEAVNPRANLLQEIRNSTQVKAYKEAGYSFNYVYRSKSNPSATLFETTITANDYKD